MYIGKVSKLTGASRKAIYHYEELGLISGVTRSGQYRVYDDHHVVIISMIRRAQALGFKLSEMAPLMMAKVQQNRFPLEMALEAIEAKRDQIRQEIQKAKQRQADLDALEKELLERFPPPTAGG